MNEVNNIAPGSFSCVPCYRLEDVPQRMHDRSAKNSRTGNINLNRVAISCGASDWFLVT
jgi:hypothetical protein